ncbi:MAG TPA: hypothetical protein VG734_13440 [Lacunisphaera sp.]|nr:hypothetical protein [Lacunisphaera sp.]
MTAIANTATLALVPGDRFFLKEIELDPAVAAAKQVEMALEESSPFPLAQLYFGFVVRADGARALVYAAYRRRFTAEEIAAWAGATAVLPDFLGLLGPVPGGALAVVQVHPAGVSGAAWDGRAALPVAIVTKPGPQPTETQVNELVAELRQRLGRDDVEVKRIDGATGVGLDDDGAAVFRIAGGETVRFPAAAVAQADVRDKAFLEEKRRDDRRQRGWTWAFRAAIGLLLVAVGLDLVAGGLGVWSRRRQARVASRTEEVRRIETAQTLATRIEDLTARQEKPLEWLALAGSLRPRSIQFTRVSSNNDRSLAIEAQTSDPAAVGAYESLLRQRREIASVDLHDIRSREGLTNFALDLTFNPAVSAARGGQP